MTASSATLRAALAALLLAGPAVAGPGGLPYSVNPANAAEAARFVPGLFVPGLGDVPAMPGLAATGEEPLVFDKPDGRIVQAVLTGRVDRKAVTAFYDQTMPQLGWTRTAERTFIREGEELRLEFAGNSSVRFVLKPR